MVISQIFDVFRLAAICFLMSFLETFPCVKIVQLLICCSPHRIVQKTIIKRFVAIFLGLGGILIRLMLRIQKIWFWTGLYESK